MNPLVKRQQLQELAERMFVTSGLRGVTVDGLCRQAGVSKKTFYRLFPNKATLVTTIVQEILVKQQEQITAGDPADILQELHLLHSVIMELTGLQWLFDQHALRFYPEACQLLKLFKTGVLLPTLQGNYRRGVAAGSYRRQQGNEKAVQLLTLFLEFLLVSAAQATVPLALDTYLNGILKTENKIE